MRRPREGLHLALCLVLSSAWPGAASARDIEAPHTFGLHPTLTAGVGIQTNPYLVDSAPITGPLYLLDAAVPLAADAPGWKLDAALTYGLRRYIDPDPNDAIHLANLDYQDDVGATFGLDAARQQPVGLRVRNVFAVHHIPVEHPETEGSALVEIRSNDGRLGVILRPDSAVELGAHGTFRVDDYRAPAVWTGDAAWQHFNTRLIAGPLVTARWLFLPRTDLEGKAAVTTVRWRNNLVPTTGDESAPDWFGPWIAKPDSTAWRVSAGLKGSLNEHVFLELTLGYGQAYYDERTVQADPNAATPSGIADLATAPTGPTGSYARDLTGFPEGVLVQAQFAWLRVAAQTLKLGYKRDFQDAFFTNYVAYDYLYVRYASDPDARLALSAEFGWRHDAFRGEVMRDDAHLTSATQVSLRLHPRARLQLGWGWDELACADTACDGGAYQTATYDNFTANLGLRLAF